MRRRLLPITVVVLAAALVAALLVQRHSSTAGAVHHIAGTFQQQGAPDIESDLYVPAGVDAKHPAPAILLAHGLGENQHSADITEAARRLARAGYVVRTFSARGSGNSGGRVGIDDPATDIADVRQLIDNLAETPEVTQDAHGDPRVAIIGTSLGGGLALLTAEADPRVDAVAAIFAWYSLPDALEPNGVLKQAWASNLFAATSGTHRIARPCGNLEASLCQLWSASAQAGAFTPAALDQLIARSPQTHVDQLHAPTLIVQGQYDSLFDFSQATRLAAALAKRGTPHRVEWVRAGHDAGAGLDTQRHVDGAVARWLDRYLKRNTRAKVGAPLTVQLGAGRGYGDAKALPPRTIEHRISLNAANHTDSHGRIEIVAPPLGMPAMTTTLPGLGDVTQLSQITSAPQGQLAQFVGLREPKGLEIVGSPRVRLRVTSDQPEVTLFAHLVDVGPTGQRMIPRALVTPIRHHDSPELPTPQGADVEVTLPPIAWRVAPAHRLGLEVSTTDAGYVANRAPQTIAIGIDENQFLIVPIVQGLIIGADNGSSAAHTQSRRLAVAGALALLALLVGLALARRATVRERSAPDAAKLGVPIVVERLAKRYRSGVTAVDDISFSVEAGAIVGLVGPNGAGKTTVLRMLLGLARPTRGEAWIFGHPVRPGTPTLRRVGALVEGPGLAPQYNGRQHLERYWGATGRDRADANIDAVLAAVELTHEAHRKVSTWSHGMRQRLGIAQALLGTPDLVVLDEPTNGLDPAQIRHLRELIREIAAEGRTVLLSSHLLSELEQVSSHVVLIANGRVLDAGTLADVVGEHDDLESAFLSAIAANEARIAFGDDRAEDDRDGHEHGGPADA